MHTDFLENKKDANKWLYFGFICVICVHLWIIFLNFRALFVFVRGKKLNEFSRIRETKLV